MAFTIYRASVPVFCRMLTNLGAILDKAVADAEERKIDPAVFVTARLAPDMLALARQVQVATDTAKGCGARLAGIEVPGFADTEATFPELKARIDKTVAFLEGVPADKLEGSEDRIVTIKIRGNDVSFSGADYLANFAMPNFYFHVTTAYAILRHNGVKVGKPDFLGGV